MLKKKKKSYRNPKVHTETRVKEMKDFDGMKFWVLDLIYIYIYKIENFDFWLTSPQFSTSVFFIYIFNLI